MFVDILTLPFVFVVNQVCRSGHCNILFRCESNIPEHLRVNQQSIYAESHADDTGDGAAAILANTASGGIVMWGAVFAALAIFVLVSFVMCRKKGTKNPSCCSRKMAAQTRTKPAGLPVDCVDEKWEACDVSSIGGAKSCGSATSMVSSLGENQQNENDSNEADDKPMHLIDPEMELALDRVLEHVMEY
jgi:hypothetical protein